MTQLPQRTATPPTTRSLLFVEPPKKQALLLQLPSPSSAAVAISPRGTDVSAFNRISGSPRENTSREITAGLRAPDTTARSDDSSNARSPLRTIARSTSVPPTTTLRPTTPPADPLVRRIEKELLVLAGPELHGRGSGTADELAAARHLADKLRELGIQPSAAVGGYVQDVSTVITKRGITKRDVTKPWHTRNVIGVLPGSDPLHQHEVILLSAHLDHLGQVQRKQDVVTYPGADDDASGCVAVLELARALSLGKRPKRTVMFVFFGSEETGGQGNQHFLANPPVPLENIVANLEFEMIGRKDASVGADELWLTGFEHSSLGPKLQELGAKIVADPHPEENFFKRSDNYALALHGVVAQTISSFGLHQDYHQPTDDVAHIDLDHMEQAIAAMVEPVRWLANSDYVPDWRPGHNPATALAA